MTILFIDTVHPILEQRLTTLGFTCVDGTSLSYQEAVVGDVIILKSGIEIPADCILLDGIDISCDESAMTGEPDQMEKSAVTESNYEYNPDPFLLGKT